MSVQAQDLIKGAMKHLTLIDKSETPSNDELQDGLSVLNMMIDSWSNELLMMVAQTPITFPLTANVPSYAIGPGQTVNVTQAPLKINSGVYNDARNNIYPLEVITRREYYAHSDRLILQAPPATVFYDEGNTQQTIRIGTAYFYPMPDASTNYTATLQCDLPLTEFTSLTDSYTFPNGYRMAIEYNLAIAISPDYGKNPSALILKIAKETKDALVRLNSRRVISVMEFGKAVTPMNILTRDFN